MPNLSALLKAEITRLARKEIRASTTRLHKAVNAHRSEIAALKRRAAELERRLRQALRSPPRAAGNAGSNQDEHSSAKVRFSAKSLISQRKRLDLSAADLGLLFGTTAQSVYNWETGRARPSVKHIATLAALRKLGRKQAAQILEARRIS
jgi:DNA-binding transcriptional regulator YiaG